MLGRRNHGFTVLIFIFLCGQEHGELQLRSDLLDCHVDVCSPEVLVQLSDNFDYQVSLFPSHATRDLHLAHQSHHHTYTY